MSGLCMDGWDLVHLNQREHPHHLPSHAQPVFVGQPPGNATQVLALNPTRRTADYSVLPGSQEHPGDLNHSPKPCSARHFPCTEQNAYVSGRPAHLQRYQQRQVLLSHPMLCNAISRIQALLTQPLVLNTGNKGNLHEHEWSKPPNPLTLELGRWKSHVGQSLLCILVQMYTEKGVEAELRQWEAWREGGRLLLEITLKHITNLLNHCGLPCISE